MIKKLELKRIEDPRAPMLTIAVSPNSDDIINKINEIIDVVNDESGFNREIDELNPDGTVRF